ncbi:MAG: hypothetical protein NTX57_13675 [Armatimonadetes bacterium]|nr:hypothetical protein [Armatimonadota bacterium]
MRLHGTGEVLGREHPEFGTLATLFPDTPGTRAVIRITVTRISDSCGFAVPVYDFREPRDVLTRWASNKVEEGLRAYRAEKNARSLDGLPGLAEP